MFSGFEAWLKRFLFHLYKEIHHVHLVFSNEEKLSRHLEIIAKKIGVLLPYFRLMNQMLCFRNDHFLLEKLLNPFSSIMDMLPSDLQYAKLNACRSTKCDKSNWNLKNKKKWIFKKFIVESICMDGFTITHFGFCNWLL